MQRPSPAISKTPGSASFLRWAGSKKQLLPTLGAFWREDFVRYVEPFAGSACLFFKLQPASGLLSDVNPYLVTTLKAVRDEPEAVWALLQRMPTDKESYYRTRSLPMSLEHPEMCAAHFIFLNRCCFNGLYRTNLAGHFNVPYGGTKGGHLPSLDTLLTASSALQNAEIECCDFEDTLRRTVAGDFVYIDPPYSVRSRRVFREYDASLFGIKSLIRLKSCITEMSARGVHFIVSYASSPEADFLTAGLPTRNIEVRRTIASFSRHRKTATEVIALSNFIDEGICLSN